MKKLRYGEGTPRALPVAMYPPHELRATIETLASAECRTLGKQVEALVREALAARAMRTNGQSRVVAS